MPGYLCRNEVSRRVSHTAESFPHRRQQLCRGFAAEVRLALVALAELAPTLRAAAAAPRARAAARAAAVAPLLPRAAVGIRTGIEGFDVLGLEILIRISVVIPVWKSTSESG